MVLLLHAIILCLHAACAHWHFHTYVHFTENVFRYIQPTKVYEEQMVSACNKNSLHKL